MRDLERGQLLYELAPYRTHDITPISAPSPVALSPDGLVAWAVASSPVTEPEIVVWDARTATPIATLSGYRQPPWSIAFSPDGRRLLTSSGIDGLRIWDVASWRLVHTVAGCSRWALSSDGQLLIGGNEVKGTARLWEVSSGRSLHTLAGSDIPQLAIGSNLALLTDRDGKVRVWEIDSEYEFAAPEPTERHSGHQDRERDGSGTVSARRRWSRWRYKRT